VAGFASSGSASQHSTHLLYGNYSGLACDSLRHEIKFNGRSLRELAPAGIVRLRFTVAEGGKLYSFTINAD